MAARADSNLTVTPAMVGAGVDQLDIWFDIASRDRVVREIYRAMRDAESDGSRPDEVPREVMALAESIVDGADSIGIEPRRLERLVCEVWEQSAKRRVTST